MNDDTLDYMLNSISALELSRPEVSNGTQDNFNHLISKAVKRQMEYVTLQKTEVQHVNEIAGRDILKSMVSAIGAPRKYTASIYNEIGINQSYFDSLREKLYIDKTSKVIKGNLNIKTLVADILQFCSDEEIDELIACITSDSEYLSRKGYNSINLKGD